MAPVVFRSSARGTQSLGAPYAKTLYLMYNAAKAAGASAPFTYSL